MRRALVVSAAVVIAAACVPAAAADSPQTEFTRDEVRRILRHGPWPQPWSPDPSNRVSGRAAAIAFVERLFF